MKVVSYLIIGILLMSVAFAVNTANTMCYQETANISTSCGGLATGAYDHWGDWATGYEYSYDGNWNTASTGNPAIGTVKVNYTIPNSWVNATGAIWQIKYGNSTINKTVNVTIPDYCFNKTAPLQVEYMIGISTIELHCWALNGTRYQMYTDTDHYSDVYEEAIYWDETYQYGIDNCSNSFSIPSNATALNLYFYDQMTNSLLTSNFNGVFYYDSTNYNFTKTDTNNQSFCVYPNWYSPTVTGQIYYSKDNYISKLYYIDGDTTLNLNNVTQNLNLYMVSVGNSTTTKITWITDSYLNVNGVLYTYQCTGGGTKTLIETSQIIAGDSYVNINLLNSLYSYEVLYNGVLYTDNTTYSKCHIENTNTVSYIITVGEVNVEQPIGMYAIGCNISGSNNTVYMVWGTNPYSTLPIEGCLFSYRNGIGGQVLVDSACVNGTSINRTIPVSGYSYIVTGKLYQGGYSIPCKDSVSFNTATSVPRMFGIMGIFSVAFLVISMALFFAGDDIKQQVGAIIGIIVSWIFGILAFDWKVITAIVFFVVIIMIVGRSATKR